MDGPTEPTRSPWAPPLDGEGEQPMVVVPGPEVVVTPPAPKSRRGLWIVVGAVAALVAVVGGLLVAGTGDDDSTAGTLDEVDSAADTDTIPISPPATTPTTVPVTTVPATVAPTTVAVTEPATTVPEPTAPTTIGPIDVAPGTYEFAAAIEAAGTQVSQRFSMTSSFAGTGSNFEGALDDQQRMEMTVDVGTGTLKMVMDIPGGMAYYSGGPFDEMITTDATWVGLDLAAVLEQSGQSLDGLLENLSGSTSAAGALAGLDATPLGLTDIDGESVMLYQVTLDGQAIADELATNPQFMAEGLPAEMMDSIESITYSVYVTAANTLRRIVSDFELMGSEFSTKYDILPIEAGFAVVVPDPATVQVIDPDELG